MITRKSYTLSGILLTVVVGGFLLAKGGAADESAAPTLRPEGARVTLVAGQVDVIRGGKTQEGRVPLFARSYVYPGDRIVTGTDGRAELTMVKPARTIRIERASILALEGRVDGERIAISGARVDSGDVWMRAAAGKRAFELGLGDLSARVAEGVVTIHRSDATRLVVFEGGARLVETKDLVQAGEGVELAAFGEMGSFIADSNDLTRGGWLVAAAESQSSVAVVDVGRDGLGPRKLTRDIRDLSPAIYLGVELELEGEGSDKRFHASEARIRKIRVRSSAWDRLRSDKKVELLNETFDVLNRRYPGIKNTVVLEFDDARPGLELRYALDLRS